MKNAKSILIGNSFPLGLIRRSVRICTETPTSFRAATAHCTVVSFWGHENTRQCAQQFSGIDLTPKTERPVVKLNRDALPELNGKTFHECWILSPDYKDSFRPSIGEEVPAGQIEGWQILKITWE